MSWQIEITFKLRLLFSLWASLSPPTSSCIIFFFVKVIIINPFCIHVSFVAPIEGLCCKPKYRANIIHHCIFVFFLYFFYHSSCRKDQFTVFSLKYGTQDFTDFTILLGLLKIRWTLTGLSLWFCLHNCFWYKQFGHAGPRVLLASPQPKSSEKLFSYSCKLFIPTSKKYV